MKLADLDVAYQIQKKFLGERVVGCYKVGGSNYRSAAFFGIDHIILGGIEKKNIFFNRSKSYLTTELELIVKVKMNVGLHKGSQILESYVGLECPNSDIDNPEGSPFVCIADNCASGDLVLLKEYSGDYSEKFSVCVNDRVVIRGSFDALKFPVENIICDAISLIQKHHLPHEDEIYIATGGLTNTFPLSANDMVEVEIEK